MSGQSKNSSDVTLAQKCLQVDSNQPVCRFNQTGVCKFRDNCGKMHVNTLCSNIKYNKTGCNNRHPKQCRNFFVNGKCIFNNECSFAHNKSETNIKLEDLKMEVNQLKSEVELLRCKLLESENKLLRKSVENLKTIVLSNTESIKSFQEQLKVENKCDICGYKASSPTTLKSHITKKHKHKSLREGHDKDLGPLPTVNELRHEDYEHREREVANLDTNSLYCGDFKCENCGTQFKVGKSLDEHMVKMHIDQN